MDEGKIDEVKSIADLTRAFREVAGELQARTSELEATALRYETALEAAPNAMLMVDSGGRIVLLNRQAETLFGYERDELIGRRIDMLVPDSVRERHPSLRDGFFQDPKVRSMGAGRDLSARRKDGSEVPVEIGLNPFETPDGVQVMASIVDISERLAAEQRFRLALEAAPNAMLMVDAEGVIVLLNEQVQELFGYGRDQLLGRSIDLLVPDSVQPRHPNLREGFFEEPKRRLMGAGRDLTARRKDGSEVPVEIGLNPLETANGVFVMASVVDISERKLAEERLRSEQIALQRSKELEQLSYLTSHDLRQPLNTVTNFAKLLAKSCGDKLDQTGIDCIKFITEGSDRMSRLIVDLLDYSRLGQVGDDPVEIDCRELVAGVCKDLRSLIEESGAIVDVGDLPVVQGFDTQLRVLFQNLISNAIKFKKPDQLPRISIAMESKPDRDPGAWHFTVTDNGIGIDSKYADRIFQIFQRLHSAAELEGTGIGLAHCKKVVELHRGSIWVESTPGTGSVFHFTIRKNMRQEVRA